MSDKSGRALGELESLVLLAVMRREGDAYGITVREEVREQAGRSLTLGTIYKTLVRLEAKGFLDSAPSAPTPRRGGRRRKLYRATAHGRRALARSLTVLNRMAQGLSAAAELP